MLSELRLLYIQIFSTTYDQLKMSCEGCSLRFTILKRK
ncbi:hypothetical protein CEXT_461021, partial [Caerostris extrusa]